MAETGSTEVLMGRHSDSLNPSGSFSPSESTRPATQIFPPGEATTRRNTTRRPPVSMLRLYNTLNRDGSPISGSAEQSLTQHVHHGTGPVCPTLAENTLPEITVEEPTSPIEVRPEDCFNERLGDRLPTVRPPRDHAATPRRHLGLLPLFRGSFTTSTTSESSAKKTLKVSFAEKKRLRENSPHIRSTSADTATHDASDLLHPLRALLPAARNPFDDSFGDEVNQPHNTPRPYTTNTSYQRQLLPDPVGLREKTNRRLSHIGPLDGTSRSNAVQDGSLAPSRKPSGASSLRIESTGSAADDVYHTHGHSKWLWNRRPSFRDPFHRGSHEVLGAHLREDRSVSETDLPRPSPARRMTSYLIPENPIPPKYRTRSVSSLTYFVTPLEKNNKTIPIFGSQIEAEKENVEKFLAAVEILQSKAARKPWQSKLFKIAYFFVILCIIYTLFVGQPLWDGLGLMLYRWIRSTGIAKAGTAIFMSWAAFQAFVPMLCTRFEQEVDDVEKRDASEVALVIPAYKAAKILPETIRHALKIFKPEQIFIMANGNSPTPLDDTADVCKEFGVNVAWVPIGSKITAEFVGVALTSKYKYILLIDDDVHLPANLPIVTDRIRGNTKCIGYTIKSTGENGSKGTLIQQCQDMEYKLSGLTRTFCGKFGSATFPHGAIILWDRATLQSLFNVHPGYAISEDWFFGYAARASGHRIQFCSQVFVETETPPSLFFTSGPARGGFGEMTVFKQRFYRWNFFWSHRLWEDTIYIIFSWRLGWRELVTKLWVTVELYDCIMSFLRPWVIVLAAIANYKLLLIFIAALTAMYAVAFITFNSWHLRKKKEMVAWKIMPVYITMKFTLMWVNVVSVYYDLYCYGKYFSVKHPRVIETRAVLEAAYKARLGPDLVALDTQLGDATGAPDKSQGVEAAVQLDGVLPLAAVS